MTEDGLSVIQDWALNSQGGSVYNQTADASHCTVGDWLGFNSTNFSTV